jgi:CRISPR-associated protein Cmr5
MKPRLKQYIPRAIDAIAATLTTVGENGQRTNNVDERYDGYAASLGAAIVTSGITPAIAFYTDLYRSGKSGVRRFHILKIITTLLHEDGVTINNHTGNNALLNHVLNTANHTPEFKQKLLDATIAVKLALRNFNHVKTS